MRQTRSQTRNRNRNRNQEGRRNNQGNQTPNRRNNRMSNSNPATPNTSQTPVQNAQNTEQTTQNEESKAQETATTETVTQSAVIERLTRRLDLLEQENRALRQGTQELSEDPVSMLSDEEHSDSEETLRSAQITLPSNLGMASVRLQPEHQQNIMVQNINIEKLTELTYLRVSDFLHEFMALRENYPNLKIGPYISRTVKEALENRGIDVKSTTAVLTYLYRYKKRQERYRKKFSIDRLKKELQWPVGIAGPRDQIHLFFDEVAAKLKNLSQTEKKSNKKLIAKIITKRIPKVFRTGPNKLTGIPKLKDLDKLKARLLERYFVLEEDSSSTTSSSSNQKPKPKKQRDKKLKARNVTCKVCDGDHEVSDCKVLRAVCQIIPPQPDPKPVSVKQAIVEALSEHRDTSLPPEVIRVRAAKLHDIQIYAKHVETGKYEQVQGLLDTGATRNVGCLSKLRAYCKVLEEPRRISYIEFPDLTTKPVKLVGRIDIRLHQGQTELGIGEQLVFLVDDPSWQDLLIGKLTIDKYNLSPNLSNAKTN